MNCDVEAKKASNFLRCTGKSLPSRSKEAILPFSLRVCSENLGGLNLWNYSEHIWIWSEQPDLPDLALTED